MNGDSLKGLAQVPAIAMTVLLFVSAYFEWWGFFQTVAGAMIVGAMIGAIVTSMTKEVAAIPVIGGLAGIVGVLLHVLIRIQMWWGN